MAVPLDGAHCIYLATECGECRVVDPLPPPSLSVCVRARLIIHLSYQRMDGCIPYTLWAPGTERWKTLWHVHIPMQLAPSPLSLSLSLGQLPLAQLINDRMMHFQIARPSIAIWPARIRLALSLISVSLRHIGLLSLVFSPFHKAFPSSDVYREGRVVEHQNVPDLKWSTSIHLSYSMVRIRLAGSSQLYELCIKRNQEKKNFFYLAGIKTSCIRSCGETNLLPRFSL